MGRPKLQTPRDRQFNVGLTAAEWSELHRAARVAGMRPVDYGRTRLLSKPSRVARTEHVVHPVDPLVVVQLVRIGNNLNQIARHLNALALPAPDDLAPVLAEIRSLLRAAPLA